MKLFQELWPRRDIFILYPRGKWYIVPFSNGFQRLLRIMFHGLDHIWLKRSLCIITGIAALAAAWASLSWRMVQDTPVIFYLSNKDNPE